MTEVNEKNNTTLCDWPVNPTFLSMRSESANKYSASPNKDGLFYANELRGILADASAAFWENDPDVLKNANKKDLGGGRVFALFQVVLKEFAPIVDERWLWFAKFSNTENDFIHNILFGETEKTIIRIHPGNLYPNLDCCEMFRNCEYIDEDGNKQSCSMKCFEMDSRIALLYSNDLYNSINGKNDEHYWDKFYNELEKIKSFYNTKIEEKYKNDVQNIESYHLITGRHEYKYGEKKENRPYVGYRCIYSGLMEYFFPIVHAGKVIAVLMYGQCPPPGLKPGDMFAKYRAKMPDFDKWIENREKMDKIEMNENKKFFYLPDNHKPIGKEQLDYIAERIEKLENRINYVVEARSQKYVSHNFFEIENNFREKVVNVTEITNKSDDKKESMLKEIEDLDISLNEYKVRLSDTLKEIIMKFEINGFIRIYAIESTIANRVNTGKDSFYIIGDSDFNPKNPNSSYSKIIVNKIKERYGSLDKKDLLESFDGSDPYFPKKYWELVKDFDPDSEKDIFRVEFSFLPQIAYIIWEKYENLNRESDQYKEYNNYLTLMYHTLLEPYIILERMKLEKNLESTMRISSHESAQIIPEVLEEINYPSSLKYINDVVKLYRGPEKITKSTIKIIDVSRRLSLLNNLFKRLSNIFNEEKPKCAYVDFHRIVYAPKSLFLRKANLDKYQSITIECDPNFDRFSLYTDYGDLNHILFNLMDNAIKYGLQGSNIRLNVQLIYGNKKNTEGQPVVVQLPEKLTISVISYGDELDDKDRKKIFELYYRSVNVKGNEGMGIGLFLVKKLCNRLGYSIECMPSKEIAAYNLPLKYHYLEQNMGFADNIFSNPNTLDILLKTIEKEQISKVINTRNLKNDWKITNVDLEYGPEPDILNYTYQNEFKITIPINGNELKQTNLLLSWEKYY